MALRQGLAQAVAADVEDPGPGVRAVGEDARLRARERAGAVPEVVEGHGHEGARDALPGGEEHVHLTWVGPVGDLAREGDEAVGRLAAGGHDREDVVAVLAGLRHAPRHVLDLVRVGDRAAAELHHPQADGRPPGSSENSEEW